MNKSRKNGALDDIWHLLNLFEVKKHLSLDVFGPNTIENYINNINESYKFFYFKKNKHVTSPVTSPRPRISKGGIDGLQVLLWHFGQGLGVLVPRTQSMVAPGGYAMPDIVWHLFWWLLYTFIVWVVGFRIVQRTLSAKCQSEPHNFKIAAVFWAWN